MQRSIFYAICVDHVALGSSMGKKKQLLAALLQNILLYAFSCQFIPSNTVVNKTLCNEGYNQYLLTLI